uniref:Peptidase S1 domain-containing protein n=1 Tax=Pseudonaja textilis TaxID=8673 RepID=A0A670ZMQ7_PSETE
MDRPLRTTCTHRGSFLPQGDSGGPLVSMKIVGGLEASHGEVPWQVTLKEGLQHFCGAVIIGERWLLSAAHCFNHSSVKVGIQQVVLHPSYNPALLDFDVAVLQLARPLRFGRYIQPICLPLAAHKFPVGRKCLVSGWGTPSPCPENLHRAAVGILEQATCEGLYNVSLSEQMICAGLLEGKVDACQGDSGGPLACEETPGTFYLAGLVSWAAGCGQAKKPGVYARITKLKTALTDEWRRLPGSTSTPSTMATCWTTTWPCWSWPPPCATPAPSGPSASRTAHTSSVRAGPVSSPAGAPLRRGVRMFPRSPVPMGHSSIQGPGPTDSPSDRAQGVSWLGGLQLRVEM